MRWFLSNQVTLTIVFFIFIIVTNSYKNVNLTQLLINNKKTCWGFENNCEYKNSFSSNFVKCNKASKWSTIRNKFEQVDSFWKSGDFGFLKKHVSSLKYFCKGEKNSSFLKCSYNLRFCQAKDIFFNLKNLDKKFSERYRSDVIQTGQVGGKCELDYHLLKQNLNETGYLQSWAMELKNFKSKSDFSLNSKYCDIIFEKPTIIIKLDAAVNMYHHFCDFINLFASQFLNNTYFEKNIDIFLWDTYSGGYVDTMFNVVWKAFSNNPPFQLINYSKKKICFRNVIFSLLARQIFGLYYNLPLVDNCEKSGFFYTFSYFLLNRLNITRDKPNLDKIRITFLQRKTRFRQIINIDELYLSLITLPNVDVKIVAYENNFPFKNQLQISQNTDIFIGIHGSGLTHLLFLPDWAVVFELYNCGDEHCYKDLARLRGIKYWTWKKKDKIFPQSENNAKNIKLMHQKFLNYVFDVYEFKKNVIEIIEYVRRHSKYVNAKKNFLRSLNVKKEL